MADWRNEGPVTLSVLDRLIDEEPRVTHEPPLTRAQSMRALKAALRRDLEWLLNTRSPVNPAPEGAPELQRSLYSYGLPDLHSLNLSSREGYERMAQLMETAIIHYEPRLMNVRVHLAETPDEKAHVMRFVIEGLLRVDPAPEFVAFDTALELTNGEYEVKGEALA